MMRLPVGFVHVLDWVLVSAFFRDWLVEDRFGGIR